MFYAAFFFRFVKKRPINRVSSKSKYRAAGEAIREFKSAFNGVGKLKDDVVEMDGVRTGDAEKQADGEEKGS
ncbi:hypothetical protein FACS1894163_13490 [Spirochaetia bacterium]|nr:hypothetical protein FACS1894163_13490 [Spirochaetia bacterium]